MNTQTIETQNALAEMFLKEVVDHCPDYRQFRTSINFFGEEYHSNVKTLRQMVGHLNVLGDHPSLICIEGRKLPGEEWVVV